MLTSQFNFCLYIKCRNGLLILLYGWGYYFIEHLELFSAEAEEEAGLEDKSVVSFVSDEDRFRARAVLIF